MLHRFQRTASISLFALPLCVALTGLAMSPAELLTKLDLSYPGLVAVGAAQEAGDTERALVELLAYLQRRTEPCWYVSSPLPPPQWDGRTDPAAEAVLRREYTFVGKTATLSQDLDWNANPLRDPEWPIELNRHGTWGRLIRAYNQTGNTAYADDFIRQLEDWCTDNPRPKGPRQARYTWRTLECGIRLSGSWPGCFFASIRSPRFTARTMATMLAALWQQADYLTTFHGGGNWLVTETAGLVTCGVLFPEFADSGRWLEMAFGRLEREIDQQVPPDGAQVELTPHYHSVTLRSFHAAVRIAEHNGVPVPPAVKDGIMRMVRYLAYVSKPDGRIPMFNDSDHGSVRGRLKPFATGLRPDIQFIATQGVRGKRPQLTSVAFPYAGQYIMRSGWDPDALYLAFDAGPYGLGHQHEDKLQIDVHAFGRSHILDPGRFTYARSPWRSYFVSTHSHSTVLVDNLGQERRRTPRETWVGTRPQSTLWATNDLFDLAVGVYEDGYGGRLDDVIHIRKVFFKRGEYWIVHDLLLGKDGYAGTHRVDVQFQFGAAGAQLGRGGKAVFSHNDDANLAVIPLSDRPMDISLREGEETPPRGWVAWSLHRASKEAATLAAISQRASLPIRIDTLLFPYRGNASPDVSMIRLPGDSTQESLLRISSPEWSDTYTCSHALTEGRSSGAAAGGLTWIRTNREGETIATAGTGSAPGRPAADLPEPERSPSPSIRIGDGAVHCRSREPGTLLVDYGFAEGGGFLFHAEAPVRSGPNRLVLQETRTGRGYVYRALLLDEDGSPVEETFGTFKVAQPVAFGFDDGRMHGWTGGELVEEGERGFLHAKRPPETAATYVAVSRLVSYVVQPDLTLRFRFRTSTTQAGDWFYCKAFLEDVEGRHWAAYFARSPSPKWCTVSVSRPDFRPDAKRKGDYPSKSPHPGVAIRRVGFILRKGKTDVAGATILDLDDIVWSIR
ncbi:MAG: alginate lyase family protein [Lentisphaerae bacterium]|jgi:hypothetical protein|nr:alginate lyase family protein [Lentisphaerota bacterium]MBT4819907.1 alginate lyase family protein [Lentisphaerota bacterium]MBT5608172.1 alginate lyase family protein [Lentisphaerota bacterium]MBT7058939.1 alginate lyase family protein [Lentisphaerota bacterium]MBT7842830.1 alginate lyase family protein [Lentisphaerota bacterium]